MDDDGCLRCGGNMDEGDPEFCSKCEPSGSPSSFRTPAKTAEAYFEGVKE